MRLKKPSVISANGMEPDGHPLSASAFLATGGAIQTGTPSTFNPPRPSIFILHPSSFIFSSLALVLSVLLLSGCGAGERPLRNMLDPASQRAALRQFQSEGVELTIRESAGLDRVAEPVTSGVPLLEGTVSDPARLVLADVDGQPVPCQAVVQSRWPDGSAKWVLLDFQATVASNAVARYTLSPNGPASPAPDRSVTIVQETDTALVLDNGRLNLTFDKTSPGLIHAITLDGEPLVAPDHPVGTTLVNGDNIVYHASAPDRFEIEHRGPMRTVVRIGGHYVAEDGQTIHDGKVGYDLRVSVYADKPWLGLDFTLRNDGFYGYRNESQRRRRRPRQWLHFKSLSLDVPVKIEPNTEPQIVLAGKNFPVEPETESAVAQWYKYPYRDIRNQTGIRTHFGTTNLAPHMVASGMAKIHRGYYSVWTTNGVMSAGPERIEGLADLRIGPARRLRMANRRFRENFPRGFSAVRSSDPGAPVSFSLDMFPAGGWYPQSLEAFQAGTYQFEGGRRKTAAILFGLAADESPGFCSRSLDQPLRAVAPGAWYRDAGAVFPLSEPGRLPDAADERLAEAFERYDRMQRAKVILEAGDPAGPSGRPGGKEFGRVSIPSLHERYPEVFAGWMHYGDLVWSHGYCSLFYSWPYTMLLHHLRLGDRVFLDLAEDMARHRYDIDQYHVEDTATWLGGFQRYEKGEHGHLERQGPRHKQWENNPGPSHTWNRGLLLHWALTGDPRSLDAAEQNGRAYRRFFYNQHKLHEKETLPWRQFRVSAWAMENWLALYEYTGKSEHLDWAAELFDKSLLAMERENGGVGHILPNGHQSAQFTAYMIEPVIRLHHHTGRADVAEFLRRVLDWQREAGSIWGVEKDGIYHATRWREDWHEPAPEPGGQVGFIGSLYFSLQFADGYAWLHRIFGRQEDLAFAGQLFRDVVFYYYYTSVRGEERSPLGYHFGGDIANFGAKFHAFTGRHGMLYLQTEAGE